MNFSHADRQARNPKPRPDMRSLISGERDRAAVDAKTPSPCVGTRNSLMIAAVIMAAVLPLFAQKASAKEAPQKKEYLSNAEADKVRDAATPSDRMKLF